jgi:hypothetical protein
MDWYAVRCIIKRDASTYEERITLWNAHTFEEAVELAEAEVTSHCKQFGLLSYLDLAQAYRIGDEPIESGDEVFSLLRDSNLAPEEYLNTYFDTGNERQGTM